MYLEHYLDSLESLPKELQKNFYQMRDLDTESQVLLVEIDKLADDYLLNFRTSYDDVGKREEKMTNIQDLFSKNRKFSDEKVQLALQTYELVDRHIRRLDADLARFESELKDRPLATQIKREKLSILFSKSNDKPVNRTKDLKCLKRRKERESITEILNVKKNKIKRPDEESGGSGSMLASLIPSSSSDVLDMPVDPNEPTYCTCHQVSYGEMIGCDNPDCPIEWFHFGCVGLSVKPKGKWYCGRCLFQRKKKL